MTIQPATEQQLESWLIMRKKLWPSQGDDDFLAEMKEMLTDPKCHVLVAFDLDQAIGFAELSIRDYAEGCATRKIGYLEGIFVEEDYRQQGIAGKLIQQAESWFAIMGCTEMASDTELNNSISIQMHQAYGFTALPTIIPFMKKLSH